MELWECLGWDRSCPQIYRKKSDPAEHLRCGQLPSPLRRSPRATQTILLLASWGIFILSNIPNDQMVFKMLWRCW